MKLLQKFENYILKAELSNDDVEFNSHISQAKSLLKKYPSDSLELELIRVAIDFDQRNFNFKKTYRTIDSLINGGSEYYRNVGYTRKGIYFVYTGNTKLALEYLLKAKNYFNAKKDKKEASIILNTFGNLYAMESDFRKGIKFIVKAFHQLPADKYIIQRNAMLNGLTGLYSAVNDFENSKKYHEAHRKLMMENPNCDIVKFVYYFNDANFNASINRSKALQSLSELKNIVFDSDNGYQKGLYYQAKSRVNYFSMHNGESLKNIDSALFYFKKENSDYFILSCLRYKIEILKKANDFKQAFLALEEFHNFKGKTNDLFVDTFERESKLKYENVKKDLALAKLKLKNEQHKNENKRIIAILISVLTALLFLVVLLYQKIKRIRIRKKAFYSKISVNTINTILKTENRERKRISNELHDVVGVKMSVLKLMIEHHFNEKDNKGWQFLRISNFVDEIIDEIRQISHNLLPQNIKNNGLDNSIYEFAKNINGQTNLNVDYFSTGLDEPIDEYYALFIYRTVQEFLNNILKHSKATECVLNIHKIKNDIQITIEDNGVGFKIDEIIFGQGIKEIQNYVQNVNGVFEIESAPEYGTVINIRFGLTDTSKFIW